MEDRLMEKELNNFTLSLRNKGYSVSDTFKFYREKWEFRNLNDLDLLESIIYRLRKMKYCCSYQEIDKAFKLMDCYDFLGDNTLEYLKKYSYDEHDPESISWAQQEG